MQPLKYSMNRLENQIKNSINYQNQKDKKEVCSRCNISDLFYGYYDRGDSFVSPEGDEEVNRRR